MQIKWIKFLTIYFNIFFHDTSPCLIDSASRVLAVERVDSNLWAWGLWDPFQNNEVVQECGKVIHS